MSDPTTHDKKTSADQGAKGAHSHDHGGDEHGGNAKYWYVFAALCVLTTASALTYLDAWRELVPVHVGWAFMMAVSCAKAMLVITFFMHLLWEANWKYVLTIPAAFMSIFLICMLVPDVGRRTIKYSDIRWQHAVSRDTPGSHDYLEDAIGRETPVHDHSGH